LQLVALISACACEPYVLSTLGKKAICSFYLRNLMFKSFHVCFRYVSLRRRLLVDPHLPKEEARSSNLIVDNPLSQNPGI
jgi:hypothetical protein